MKTLRRILYLLRRGQAERDLQEEMAAHREMAGVPIGSELRLREEARDAWGVTSLDHLSQDLHYAARTLRKSPGFSITAVLILTLGIGVNLTLFQIVNAALLRPLEVQDPGTLASLRVRARGAQGSMSSSVVPIETARYVTTHSGSIRAGLWEAMEEMAWGDGDGAPVRAAFVSGNWFSELGHRAFAGRAFTSADDTTGSAPVGVVSFDFWQSRLAADAGVFGKVFALDGHSVTVIGVAPPSFPVNGDVWIPHSQLPYFGVPPRSVNLYARVIPGTSSVALRESTSAALKESWPDRSWESMWLEANFATVQFRQPSEQSLRLTVAAIVGGLTLLVLLIGSANLSNLVLSRAVGRLHELSLRAALGASRVRIARQLMTESLLLGSLGAAAGLALSFWAAGAIVAVAGIPVKIDFTPDLRTLTTAFLLAVLAMLAIGFTPVWRVCQQDLAGFMKDGNQQASSGVQGMRVRQFLVGSQLIGSCFLLIVAGLLFQGMRNTLNVGPGFDAHDLAILSPRLQRIDPTDAKASAFWQQVRDSAAALPGVEGTVLTNFPPLPTMGGGSSSIFRSLPGIQVSQLRVEFTYFNLMRIPILTGRTFEPGDPPDAAVVSRKMAMMLFGSLEAAGKRFETMPIIGVVEDSRVSGRFNPANAEMYRQSRAQDLKYASLLVRTKGDPVGMLPALRRAATEADRGIFADAHWVESDLLRTQRLFKSRLRRPRRWLCWRSSWRA